MKPALIWTLAFLLGSIPFGVVLARLRKVDLRQHGSGNIGATNVARTLGKTAGILTLMGDALKGIVAVLLAEKFLTFPWEIALAGGFAFFGHVYSIFLKFKGGKGVATGLGVLLILLPWPTVGAIAVFGITLWRWRYVSLSSMAGATAICVISMLLRAPMEYSLLSGIMALTVILRHKDNIRRLVAGEESQFSAK